MSTSRGHFKEVHLVDSKSRSYLLPTVSLEQHNIPIFTLKIYSFGHLIHMSVWVMKRCQIICSVAKGAWRDGQDNYTVYQMAFQSKSGSLNKL